MNSHTPKLDRPQYEVGGLQGSLDHLLEKIQGLHSADLRSKDLRIQILEYEVSILRLELKHEKSRVKSLENDFKFREKQAAQEVAAAATQVSPQDSDAESTVAETSQIVSVPKNKRRSGAAQRKTRKTKKAAAAEEDGK